MKRCLQFLLAANIWAFGGQGTESVKLPADKLTAKDRLSIKATIEKYRTSWLRNDERGVLQTFTNDAILQPAHGAPAVVGISSIKKYWFSPGPVTTLTKLKITIDEMDGDGSMAFAHGHDDVGWTISENGKIRRHYHPGTYLNVMRKDRDGNWRIQVHMWDDGAETIN